MDVIVAGKKRKRRETEQVPKKRSRPAEEEEEEEEDIDRDQVLAEEMEKIKDIPRKNALVQIFMGEWR